MAKEQKYSVLDLKSQFPSEESCLEYIFNTLHSKECSCGGRYTLLKGRKQYQCSKCRFQIAPMAGSIFEKSSTPLTLWFHAIFIFSNAKSGISAKEMERQLGVTYKTAWRILKLIRSALKQKTHLLEGDVEMDETYFGGRFRSGKENRRQKEAIRAKSVIIGSIQRKEEARVQVSPNGKAYTIGTYLKSNISPSNTRLMTDESNRYDYAAQGYNRLSVNHKNKEFARGDIHTNTIEGFWSHIKRSISGTHKSVSKRHLQSYVDGFVFHYNNRHNYNDRFSVLLGALLPH